MTTKQYANAAILLLASVTLNSSCSVLDMAGTSKSNQIVQNLQIGDSREKIMSKLEAYQRPYKLIAHDSEIREDKFYEASGRKYRVSFIRTDRISDGMISDDEFTPLVFENDKLVGKNNLYQQIVFNARLQELQKDFTPAEVTMIMQEKIVIGMSEAALFRALSCHKLQSSWGPHGQRTVYKAYRHKVNHESWNVFVSNGKIEAIFED